MSSNIPTRIRTGIVDGVPFEWWTDHGQPTSVTVRSAVFGTASELTSNDPARFATTLARRLLAKSGKQGEGAQRAPRPKAGSVPVLKKPGWFEVDPADFGTTVF